ncbi:Protein of unknown function [Lactobacillus delbrueckii subsp. bulgaricus]|nr:Protein of unknown function [Lactobacillus delbrueckii subsp. bulgaricus]CDR74655.1 Protein of unknown function [Lactobacillus delbrueckii subsp. bulgaricus]CDR76909.1 Putative uncharacterized protein [Lactobacillus delbrueckii subsp. lactis]CDR81337.1 Protein of unknown function [Lactobacillus delbrueckii subsp. lactis]
MTKVDPLNLTKVILAQGKCFLNMISNS